MYGSINCKNIFVNGISVSSFKELSCTLSEDITVNYLTCDNEIIDTNLNVSGNTILNYLTLSGLNVVTV